VIVIGLGYASVTFSLAQVFIRDDPGGAHHLAPYDGRITAAFAVSRVITGDQARADTLARRALRQDPTAIAAVATLALGAQARGDSAAARRLFGYGKALSRRNEQVQLWAIEDSVARGDIRDALRYYDIALRTSPRLNDILFPVLAGASASPVIRSALIRTLAGRPQWGDGFINFLSARGPNPRATAQLLVGLRRIGVTVPGEAAANTINTLIARGDVDDAWRYYAILHPDSDRSHSRDPRFTADRKTLSVLDWVTIDDGAISASIQAGTRGGILDFAAPASVGGTVVRQLELLPPGDYRLTGHSIEINQSGDAVPYWLVRCQDNRELGRVAVLNSAEARGVHSATFRVPTQCPVQTLEFITPPSNMPAGTSGQIDQLLIEPLQ
jgi:tetratricopeptide (TPR) repeat protein